MNEKKILNCAFKEVKIDEAKGIVEGYPSVFGNIDQGSDIMVRGAFRKTLKESGAKVPILSHHSMFNQIGWNLEAKEDSKGLFVKGIFDINNNDEAQKHFSLIKIALEIETNPGFSIGYRVIKAIIDPVNPSIRLLKEVKFIEWSPVTFPMNLEAGATGVKTGLQFLESELEFLITDFKSRGYSHFEIIKALEKVAAPQENDPSIDTQSILESIKQMRNTIKE